MSQPPPLHKAAHRRSSAPGIPIILGIAVLLLMIGITTGVYLLFRDAPPPDDADLLLALREVDPDQNPIPSLMALPIQMERSDIRLSDAKNMILGEKEWDDELVSTLLEENAEAIRQFKEASRKAEWQFDPPIASINYDMDFTNAWIATVELIKLEAFALARRGEKAQALENALTLSRFADQLQHAQGNMIIQLIGMSAGAGGQRTAMQLLDEFDFDGEQLALFQSSQAGIVFDSAAFADCYRVEYRIMKNVVSDLASGKFDVGEQISGFTGKSRRIPGASLILKKNRTTKLFARSFRSIIDEAPMIRSEAPRTMEKEMEAFGNNKTRVLLSTNAVGNILYTIGMPVYGTVMDRHAILRVGQDMLIARIALQRFYLEHGRLPASLDELVPGFLDAVPIDPFDGKPVRYDREKGLLYSVGADFENNGGAVKKEGIMRDKNEIVVPLTFAE